MMGRSRSAAVVVAYLVKYEGFTLDSAINQVITCRPVVAINSGFWSQLQVNLGIYFSPKGHCVYIYLKCIKMALFGI